jgi:beta-amyrin synthase
LQFLKEKNFEQTIPQEKVEDGEEITHEKATATLRRAIHFFSALQASDGHWPAELAGVLFFLPPLVRLIIINNFFFSNVIIIFKGNYPFPP